MANFESLKNSIVTLINANGENLITGDILQGVLLSMVQTLGEYPTFGGEATINTNPNNIENNVFYVAQTPGEYTFFGLSLAVGQVGFFYQDKETRVWRRIVLNTASGTGAELMFYVTYENLLQIVSQSALVPGAFYRITDYVTTVNLPTNDKQYDVIVQAITESKLGDDARATRRGSGYNIGECERWSLKYSLYGDNPAILPFLNVSGHKGIVYWMQDEWGNEANYDFKSIMFKYYTLEAPTATASNDVNDNIIKFYNNYRSTLRMDLYPSKEHNWTSSLKSVYDDEQAKPTYNFYTFSYVNLDNSEIEVLSDASRFGYVRNVKIHLSTEEVPNNCFLLSGSTKISNIEVSGNSYNNLILNVNTKEGYIKNSHNINCGARILFEECVDIYVGGGVTIGRNCGSVYVTGGLNYIDNDSSRIFFYGNGIKCGKSNTDIYGLNNVFNINVTLGDVCTKILFVPDVQCAGIILGNGCNNLSIGGSNMDIGFANSNSTFFGDRVKVGICNTLMSIGGSENVSIGSFNQNCKINGSQFVTIGNDNKDVNIQTGCINVTIGNRCQYIGYPIQPESSWIPLYVYFRPLKNVIFGDDCNCIYLAVRTEYGSEEVISNDVYVCNISVLPRTGYFVVPNDNLGVVPILYDEIENQRELFYCYSAVLGAVPVYKAQYDLFP